jgi:hypothetical protein
VPKLARHPYRVSILIATAVIAAQNLTLQYVDVLKKYLSPHWFGLVLTAGLTGVAYRLALHVYETRIWRRFNPDIVLAGKWKHRLVPSDRKPNNDREGEFVVIQTPFETKFVAGKNYDHEAHCTSHWESLAVFDDELSERSLWVIYEIDRGQGKLVPGESQIDRGLLRLHLEVNDRTRRVTKMSGNYWDAGLAQHKGAFEAELVDPKAAAAASGTPVRWWSRWRAS